MSRFTGSHRADATQRRMVGAGRTLLRTAAVFTSFVAPGFAASAVNRGQQYSYLLEAAGFALAFIVTALLIGMLLGLPSLVRRLFPSMPWPGLSVARLPDEGPEWAELNIRREILEERLQIDDPRICSARGIPCTCWSFCGGEDEMNHSQHPSVASETALASGDHSKHGEVPIPMIDRSKVTDCPFP